VTARTVWKFSFLRQQSEQSEVTGLLRQAAVRDDVMSNNSFDRSSKRALYTVLEWQNASSLTVCN